MKRKDKMGKMNNTKMRRTVMILLCLLTAVCVYAGWSIDTENMNLHYEGLCTHKAPDGTVIEDLMPFEMSIHFDDRRFPTVSFDLGRNEDEPITNALEMRNTERNKFSLFGFDTSSGNITGRNALNMVNSFAKYTFPVCRILTMGNDSYEFALYTKGFFGMLRELTQHIPDRDFYWQIIYGNDSDLPKNWIHDGFWYYDMDNELCEVASDPKDKIYRLGYTAYMNDEDSNNFIRSFIELSNFIGHAPFADAPENQSKGRNLRMVNDVYDSNQVVNAPDLTVEFMSTSENCTLEPLGMAKTFRGTYELPSDSSTWNSFRYALENSTNVIFNYDYTSYGMDRTAKIVLESGTLMRMLRMVW